MHLVSKDHLALKTISAPVNLLDAAEMKQLISDCYRMFGIMNSSGGRGLAANQVGITKRFFVWKYGIVVNPTLISTSEDYITSPEGCLSLPGVMVNMSRPRKVLVEFYDETGKKKSREFINEAAQIFMHELDHLNGVLIVS